VAASSQETLAAVNQLQEAARTLEHVTPDELTPLPEPPAPSHPASLLPSPMSHAAT
jgi:hypothetical protein